MSILFHTDPPSKQAFRVSDPRPLLAPRSIAVVDASDRPGADSNVLENLVHLGYPGHVYPGRPKYTELAGWRCC